MLGDYFVLLAVCITDIAWDCLPLASLGMIEASFQKPTAMRTNTSRWPAAFSSSEKTRLYVSAAGRKEDCEKGLFEVFKGLALASELGTVGCFLIFLWNCFGTGAQEK